MKSFKWVLLSVATILSITVLKKFHLLDITRFEEILFPSLFLCIAFSRFLYALLHRKFFSITITDHTLALSRGIVLRNQTSVPLQKITKVHIGRTCSHLLFGLHYLQIAFPSRHDENSNAHILLIEGVTEKDAVTIRNAASRTS